MMKMIKVTIEVPEGVVKQLNATFPGWTTEEFLERFFVENIGRAVQSLLDEYSNVRPIFPKKPH